MTFDIEWSPDVVLSKRYQRFLAQQSEPSIRVATANDLAGIIEMHERCTTRSLSYRYLSGTFRPSPAQLSQLITPTHGTSCVMTVTPTPRQREAVVGMANLIGSAADPELAEAAILVEDSWQGRGYGTAMMRRLLTLTPHLGMRQVELHVDATNRAALALIRKLYRHLDEEPRYEFDGSLITFSLRTTRRRTPPAG